MGIRWTNSALRRCIWFLALALVFTPEHASEQDAQSVAPPLSTAQIVDQLEQHDHVRMQQLQQYQSLRHYTVEYRGFSKVVTATMDVEVSYNASSGKSLRIISQTGSHLLCEKVLKRAVDSELEASRDKGATALTRVNYRFKLLGNGNLGGRPAYILSVEPLKPNKFLYRGKIWVDAMDFAVSRIEAEPSKNPSFFISRTLIEHSNQPAGGFWLPRINRSESKIRIGGTAVLTIDYGTYRLIPSELGPSASVLRPAASPNPSGSYAANACGREISATVLDTFCESSFNAMSAWDTMPMQHPF